MLKLKDVTSKIGSGATPRGGESVYLPVRQNYALIRSQNVFDHYFDSTGLAFISEEHAAELDKVRVEPNDILLNITGDGITFARTCVAPDTVLPACVNQHVAIVRVDPEQADANYVGAYLSVPLFKFYIESFNAGGSRRAITKAHIESFEIALPPLEEQRLIGRFVSALNNKIELNRRANETLEAIARAIFKSWFVDFDPVRSKAEGLRPAGMSADIASLFPSSFTTTSTGDSPHGWSCGQLEDLVLLQRGFDLPASARIPGPYPVLAASGPTGGHVEAKVKGPGVTTGRSGVLGQVFYVEEDFWPLNTSLWVKEFRRATPLFAYHVLRTLDFSAFDAGSAVPTLNRNHVHNLPMILPPAPIVEPQCSTRCAAMNWNPRHSQPCATRSFPNCCPARFE